VKKEGIIVGDLSQKISCACRITVAMLTSRNGLASLGFPLGFALCSLKFFTSRFAKAIMRDQIERDNVSLGLKYLLYVEIFQQCVYLPMV